MQGGRGLGAAQAVNEPPMTHPVAPGAAPRTGTAILLFSLGIFFFAVNDALGKWLVSDYPVGEIMLIRSMGVVLFLAPMMATDPASRQIPVQLGLHALRILVMAGDTFAFYFATKSLPLADVMTFYLAAPLFVTGMAVLLLGERIGPWRVVALLLGFTGVVIALQPSTRSVAPGAAVALGGSLMFATAMIITRRLRQCHWVTLLAGQFVGAGAIGGVASSFDWVMPSPFDAGLMVLVGLVSMMCFVSINRALRLAQASVLAPFQYGSIVWAVLLGWFIWGDLPTPAMWTGIGCIVASGAIVWLRERRAGQQPTIEAQAV